MSGGDDQELLRHHGDVDAAPGLVDFAVNVRLDRPPAWLRDRLAAALDRVGKYPSQQDQRAAQAAAAQRHGRDPEEVLILSGAAEAFSLLPALRPKLAAVIHPSFTEPELTLRTAGIEVRRVVLPAEDGYRLDPRAVPEQADLVVVGNPTNPTSVQHPAGDIRRLLRPGRVVVVDEAFADAIPGEPQSLAGHRADGLLVVRSLTKTWGLPGLRAGYALGSPQLLRQLGRLRPHWPVGTLVLEAVRACCEPAAVAEAERAALRTAEHRRELAAELAAIPGVRVVGPAHGPFLLLSVENGEKVRGALRERGIAVRRGDTFPGLGTNDMRVAVRQPDQNRLLVRALRELVGWDEA